jgi:hypothetical protein
VRTLIHVVGQTAGWFACVIGAARQRHWLGVVVVASLVAMHLVARGDRTVRRILALVLISIPFGFCFDSLLIAGGVYEPVRWVLPAPFATIWLIALWVNFALIIDIPLRWLQGHLVVAAVFGGVFGPAAYLAGQRLGALRIAEPVTFHIAILGTAWALGLAALMLIARWLPSFQQAEKTPSGS